MERTSYKSVDDLIHFGLSNINIPEALINYKNKRHGVYLPSDPGPNPMSLMDQIELRNCAKSYASCAVGSTWGYQVPRDLADLPPTPQPWTNPDGISAAQVYAEDYRSGDPVALDDWPIVFSPPLPALVDNAVARSALQDISNTPNPQLEPEDAEVEEVKPEELEQGEAAPEEIVPKEVELEDLREGPQIRRRESTQQALSNLRKEALVVMKNQNASKGQMLVCEREGCRDTLKNVDDLVHHLHIHELSEGWDIPIGEGLLDQDGSILEFDLASCSSRSRSNTKSPSFQMRSPIKETFCRALRISHTFRVRGNKPY